MDSQVTLLNFSFLLQNYMITNQNCTGPPDLLTSIHSITLDPGSKFPDFSRDTYCLKFEILTNCYRQKITRTIRIVVYEQLPLADKLKLSNVRIKRPCEYNHGNSFPIWN